VRNGIAILSKSQA